MRVFRDMPGRPLSSHLLLWNQVVNALLRSVFLLVVHLQFRAVSLPRLPAAVITSVVFLSSCNSGIKMIQFCFDSCCMHFDFCVRTKGNELIYQNQQTKYDHRVHHQYSIHFSTVNSVCNPVSYDI